jgi:hypothetical protein
MFIDTGGLTQHSYNHIPVTLPPTPEEEHSLHNTEQRRCSRCFKLYDPASPNQKYCIECQPIMRREYMRKYTSAERYCITCGTQMTPRSKVEQCEKCSRNTDKNIKRNRYYFEIRRSQDSGYLPGQYITMRLVNAAITDCLKHGDYLNKADNWCLQCTFNQLCDGPPQNSKKIA